MGLGDEELKRVKTLLHVLLDGESVPFTELGVLFEALESDDRGTRIIAAWALCLIAERKPSQAEGIYARVTGLDSFAALLASNWMLKHHGQTWLEDDGSVHVEDSRGNPIGRRSVATGRDNTEQAGPGPVVDSTRSTDSRSSNDDDADDSAGHSETAGQSADSETTDSGVDRRRRARDPQHRPPRDDAVVQDGELTVRTESTDPESVRVISRLASDRYTWTYVGTGKIYGRMQEFLLRSYVPPSGADTALRANFEDLIETWRGVDDRDAVGSVIDWGLDPNPWVLTEFANATVRSVPRLEARVAFETALEITAAVADVHEAGIRHGALSPATVLLDRSGDDVAPRIVDVGLGAILEADDHNWLPMRDVECAPELRQQEYGTVDWMTDVYQLGIVLYTLFTGRSLDSVTASEPSAIPDPTALESDLPPAADRIVGKATNAHKVMRYETVDELGRDLLSAIEDNWGEPR